MTKTTWWFAVAAGLWACGGEDGGPSPEPGSGGADAVTAQHAITLDAELRVDEGAVHFMTPAGSVTELDPANVVGRPYFAAAFEAGFAPGIDAPIHFTWGTMSDDLRVAWTTPSDLEDGPYDVVLVVYTATDVPLDAVGTDNAVVPVSGDIATFTIEEKDPPLSAGQLRVTIEGGDATMETWNKWADDLGGGADLFTDTLLLVP